MHEYNRGTLTAVSLLMATHNDSMVAADVLNALCLHDADCSEMEEYDKANLRKVQGLLNGRIALRGLD